MLTVFDKNLKPVGVLENAYAVSYERRVNQLWNASFSLPIDDPKNELCNPFNFVEITDVDGEYIGLFRIIPAKTRKLTTINEVQYECEHVLATLLNDVLFGYHLRANYNTRDNIEYILSKQTTKHWRLGDVQFTRYFHYKWENENGLLGVLFSITEPFDEPFMWTWDTQNYPWTLNLVKPETNPTAEVRFGKNLAEIEREVDPSNIVNRLYPLGAGEGVNQLDITSVNNGVNYIENPESIAKYGLQSYIWTDKRFENAESLLASARRMLDEWSVPKVSYRIKAVDLSSLTGLSIDKLTVGKVIRVTDPEIGTFDTRIVGEVKSDVYGAPYDCELTLSNFTESAGQTFANLERRQEITDAYAQGSTTLLNFGYQDNADQNIPAVIPIFIDDDVEIVNSCELTFRTKKFRAYSQATEGGGAVVTSTQSGGGQSVTSSGGGGTQTTTQSGGGSSQTSGAGGNHTHVMFHVIGYDNSTFDPSIVAVAGANTSQGNQRLYLPGDTAAGEYRTRGASGDHTHSITIPNHSHQITLPNHTHTVDIPNHTHNITLPNHTHQIAHGIYELNELPSSVEIRVDGNLVNYNSIEGNRINLVDYLTKDDTGKVKRGWHEITIRPNGRARIEADIILRAFIWTRLGGRY